MSFTPKKTPLCQDALLSISILIPTRGRPERLLKSVKSLIELAANPDKLQLLIAVDVDDAYSIERIKKDVLQYLDDRKISYLLVSYPRQGYANLHNYYNDLAGYSLARWMIAWNDDAVMETQDWDQKILEYNGEFVVLAFDTHNQHPYSIFPIIPREWYNLLGCISNHHMVDAVVSQIGYMLDIIVKIPVKVVHERYDLTGEVPDKTHLERELFEHNPQDPRDLNYPMSVQWRYNMADRIAWYMKTSGADIGWWQRVLEGTQDPWERLQQNDPNKQTQYGSVGS